jgi:transposase-like protein
MKSRNKYKKWARIDNWVTEKIILYFSEDLPAVKTSKLLWINRKTVDYWYTYFREIIYEVSIKEKQEKVGWVFELDESYFWPTRIQWKRWRWAGWKTIVFWLLKRDGKVYTEIIPDAKIKSILPIIRWKIQEWSEIHTDGWRAYDWLVDIGYEKHYRVHHGKNEFARWKQHINWIESFWSFTKRRLRKFNGIKKEFFHLYLKESEFRYNVRILHQDLNYIIQQLLIQFNS